MSLFQEEETLVDLNSFEKDGNESADEAVRDEIAERVSLAVQSDPDLLDLFQPVEGVPGPGTQRRRRQRLRQVIERICGEVKGPLPGATPAVFVESLLDDILGFGPIEDLLHDNDVEDVHINGFTKVFVKRRGKEPEEARSKRDGTAIRFRNEEHLKNIVLRQLARVNRRVDESSPLVDAQLAESRHRINVIIPPLVSRDIGWSITIRFRPEDPPTWLQLMLWGTWDVRTAVLMAVAVKARLNILVSGGTGVGKTTLLNVLGSFIQREHRVVTIEDTLELNLRQADAPRERGIQEAAQSQSRELSLEDLPNHISLLTRPSNAEGRGAVSMRDLVTNALRMSPTRLVIGEVRGVEALDMLQALNTGQDGALGTIHARSAEDAIYRLVFLVLMAGLQQLQLEQIRAFLIHNAIDFIVQMDRSESGQRTVSEVVWLRKRLGTGDRRALLQRTPRGRGEQDAAAIREFVTEDDREDKQMRQKLLRAFPNPAALAFLERLLTAGSDDELSAEDFRALVLFLGGEAAFEEGPMTPDAERQVVDVAVLLEAWRTETGADRRGGCGPATLALIDRFLQDGETRRLRAKYGGVGLSRAVAVDPQGGNGRLGTPRPAPAGGTPAVPEAAAGGTPTVPEAVAGGTPALPGAVAGETPALPVTPQPPGPPVRFEALMDYAQDVAVPAGYYLENIEGRHWEITRQPWYVGKAGGISAPDTDLSDEWGQAYIHRMHCRLGYDQVDRSWRLTRLGERRGVEVLGKGDLEVGGSVGLNVGDEIYLSGGRVRLWFRKGGAEG